MSSFLIDANSSETATLCCSRSARVLSNILTAASALRALWRRACWLCSASVALFRSACSLAVLLREGFSGGSAGGVDGGVGCGAGSGAGRALSSASSV